MKSKSVAAENIAALSQRELKPLAYAFDDGHRKGPRPRCTVEPPTEGLDRQRLASAFSLPGRLSELD